MSPCRRARGTTLVELIITIMVVSLALAGVLTVININARTSADPMAEHQAIAIAEAYLEEILTKDFRDPNGGDVGGPEAGETRATYNDVNDYHNLANNGCLTTSASCPALGSCPCDQNGNPIAGLLDYAVAVAVSSEALGGVGAAFAWRVQVTITPPGGGQPLTFSGYRTDY